MPSEVELRTAVAIAVGDRALRMILDRCDLGFNADLERLEGTFKAQDEDGLEDFDIRIGLTESCVPFGGRALVVHMTNLPGSGVAMVRTIPGAALVAAMNTDGGMR